MSSSKRHFTAVVNSKENGLYISPSPSSAARKIVSKLCAISKSKKVEFYVREITQGSKKKTYGPYLGEIIKNKLVIHLKKDKLNKIIQGGRVERFGIIEPSNFIQRQRNNNQFAVIRKNYFRKQYLFFNPIQNPTSGTFYYKYMAYETFLFRKVVIKQIKPNNIEDIDIILIDINTLEKLKDFIQKNNIFSKLNEKIKRTIDEKKKRISELRNKKRNNIIKTRIIKQQEQEPQQEPQQEQEPQQKPIIFSNNNKNNNKNVKIIEIKNSIDLKSIESFKVAFHSHNPTRKPYHTSKNTYDIIIKKDSENYYIFFIIDRFEQNKNIRDLFYRYVVYYKDLRIIFKKLNDNLSIENIDIKLINIEILLFLLNFLDILLKEPKNDTKILILTNIRNIILEEVNIKLKILYSSNNVVNYTKINYSVFENINNISNTEKLIRDGFFIQNLNKNNNNVVITKSDIRGKILKINDITYIFFSPIPLLQLRNENAYYYNYCVYKNSGFVKFKKVYKDEQSKISTKDINIKQISSEDLEKLKDFILYKKEDTLHKNIYDTVIELLRSRE